MDKIIYAGIGGFIGSIGRYLAQGMIHRWMGSSFPYGTVAVNIIGCFLIGLIMTFAEERFIMNQNLRIFLTVGILGGFTTFSSFSFESFSLLQQREYLFFTFNAGGSVVLGLAATWLGVATARLF